MSTPHSITSYDKYLCLKPNITMWVIFLFLLKAYVVLILSVANMKDRTGLIDMVYSDRLAMSLGALAGIPAALVVFSWMKRRPGAPRYMKTIWSKGRALLAISALLNASVIFVPIWMGTGHAIAPGDWIQSAIALLIVFVVYSSSYIQDCFDDFPEDKTAEEK